MMIEPRFFSRYIVTVLLSVAAASSMLISVLRVSALVNFNGDGFADAVFGSGLANSNNRVCLGDGCGSFTCSNVDDGSIFGTTPAVGYMNNDEFEMLYDALRALVKEDLKGSEVATAMTQLIDSFDTQLSDEQKVLIIKEFMKYIRKKPEMPELRRDMDSYF